MDIRALVTSFGVFFAVTMAAIGIVLIMKEQASKRIRDRLNDVVVDKNTGNDRVTSIILRDMDLSTMPFLNVLLKNAGWAQKLDTLLVQADLKIRLGSFILLMLLLAVIGLLVTAVGFDEPLAALPVALFTGAIPLFYVRYKKQKRIREFEAQFPDALDILTNALRAGLALPAAIQVVAEELPDPVASEFEILFEENRLGLDMKIALHKMAERVDSAELHLFVTAVIVQRETGGNLAEILQGTAAVIRDRFRILGDVRSLTAQARLSGLVLTLLPVGLAVFILVVAPEYLGELLDDPIGRYLIGAAVFLQIAGFLIMRRIVDIKV
jgi:tight adherence protein B